MEVASMFPDQGAALISWIPAILSTICLVFCKYKLLNSKRQRNQIIVKKLFFIFVAPVCSMLCQRFSCRSVVFVGGLLCWLGISLSFFATTLVY